MTYKFRGQVIGEDGQANSRVLKTAAQIVADAGGGGGTPATSAEIDAGADNEKVVTPLGLAGSGASLRRVTTTVATNVGTKQALLGAVPTGKKRKVTQLVLHNASANLGTYADVLQLGFDAGANNWGNVTSGQISTLSTASQFCLTPAGGIYFDGAPNAGAAGDVFGVISNDTSITATLDIDVFYYDIDA